VMAPVIEKRLFITIETHDETFSGLPGLTQHPDVSASPSNVN
jgi:hypothetical protein